VRQRRLAGWLALGLLALASNPAAATASLTCTIDDRNLSLELLGNMGRGHGAVIQLIEGEIKLRGVRGKFDAAAFKIEPASLSGQWSFGRELRIGIMPKDADKVSIFLAIIAERTKAGEDLDRYRGSYAAQVSYPGGEMQLRGKLKDCSAG
jgi:hypothetical protein